MHGKKEGTQLLSEIFAEMRLSFVVQCSFGPVCACVRMCAYVCVCVRVWSVQVCIYVCDQCVISVGVRVCVRV